MSDDDGLGAAVGTFVAVGFVYWLAVGAAMVMAAMLAGIVVVAIAAVIYLVMGGMAFVSAFASGDWAVVRDALLAPAIGLALGLLFPHQNRDIVYAILDAPNGLSGAAGGAYGGAVALLTVLCMFLLMLLLFAFFVSALGFGILVALDSQPLRLLGYVMCAAWGVGYSGTAMLIMDGTLF